jgi:hypothetical protein
MKPLLLSIFTIVNLLAYGQTVKPVIKNSAAAVSASSKTILANPSLRRGLNKSMNTVYFIPNKGQNAADVLYSFTTKEAQMFVYKDRLSLVALHKNGKDVKESQLINIKFAGANQLVPTEIANDKSPTFNYFTSQTNVSNIKAASEIAFENIYEGITLRLYSNAAGSLEFDWLVNNPADYKKIKMQFNGQDYLHTTKKGSLKLGLHFGALKLDIPQTYQLAKNGKRINIKNKFVVKDNNTAMYALNEKPIANLPLIIDPVLIWGSFMDANVATFDAYMFGGVKDAVGDLYVCGGALATVAPSNPLYAGSTAGFLATPPSGTAGTTGANGLGVDWLIMKVKADGSAVISYTFFGLSSTNTGPEQAHCISLSPNGGSVFVGGFCNSSTAAGLSLPALSAGFTGNTAFGGTSSNNFDSIPTVAVFSADLASLKYRTFIGNGTIAGDISSIEALNDNDFVVATWVGGALGNGAGAVAYASGPDITHAGSYDVYLAKFTNFNSRTWGTYVGGNGDDEVFDMRLISNGDVAFCGQFTSTVATTTALVNEVAATTNRNANITTSDAMVGVLKADGSAFNMLSMVGGSGADEFDGLEPGNCDTLFIAGTTASNNFPNIGTGVMQTAYGGGTGTATDMILFKCPASGGVTTGTGCYYGSNNNNSRDIGNSIAYLPVGTGKIFVFGSTQSATGMATANNITGNTFYNATYQAGSPVSYDMFFLECSPDFKTKYLATYVGGAGADYLGNTGNQITGKQMILLSDTSIGIFTTTHGATLLPNVISASGVFDNTKSNGTNDAWILFKLDIKDLSGDIDGGDAPINYGKAAFQIATSGANATLSLGNKVDGDIYYPVAPGATALFDNNEGNINPRKTTTTMYYDIGASGPVTANDEDALTTVPDVVKANATYSVTIPYYNNSGQTCTIYGFIDFNIDGDFADAGEQVSVGSLASNTNAAGSAGRTQTLTWTLPAGAGTVTGNSYMRLLIVQGTGSPALFGCPGGVGYIKNQAFGLGEVEDYPVAIIPVALPLTLLNFSGLLQNNIAVINWQTADELNTSNFIIERSIDGTHFSPVGNTAAAGNSSTIKNYNYSDDITAVNASVYYYRLKIIDLNGNFKYSTVVKLTKKGRGFFAEAIPNPFRQQLALNIGAPQQNTAVLVLTDLNGKLLLQKEMQLKKGNNAVVLEETKPLSNGMYLLKIIFANETKTLKLLKGD